MNSTYASQATSERSRRLTRPQIVSLLGPVVSAAGIVWAILQPYRITLLHPRGQSFWWLLIEPPLLVVLAGIVFSVVVARPLLADLEEHRAASR
jgi:cytochrome bd-type quinol oxidase subunit 2